MKLHIPVSEKDQREGNLRAPLVLVEYGDYECPHCGAAYPIIKKLQRHFGDKLLFVFRNFPLAESHPHALTAAYVAEAAGLQNKFWPVHDLIFENQQNLSTQQLLKYAAAAGTDLDKLGGDIVSKEIINKVEEDMEGGARSGVNGTPTFFINGKRYDGYYEFESLIAALEKLL
jgi:protein-disulfide isomerase